jgi:histidinol-phosphate/aromatic aminotransferase/cobyric acid decarboxylase-like protein
MSQSFSNCYHGGAFFDAIGPEFNHLKRRHAIINADVLDAWFDPAPAVLAALAAELPWLLRTSPPTHCEGMIRVIAQTRGVPEDGVLPGAGSSDLIFLALREWLTRDSRVLILDPMYGEYAHVLEAVVECHVDRLPLHREANYRVDLAQLVAATAARDYDLIILVNPNSPTGQHIPRAELESVLRQIPVRTRIWVDETYVEYAGVSPAPSASSADGGRIHPTEDLRIAPESRNASFSRQHVAMPPTLPTKVGVPSERSIETMAARPGEGKIHTSKHSYPAHRSAESIESFAAASQNVFVCKSMSKVYALSGLRAAYLCGPESSISHLRRIAPPWAVSLPAQVAAVAALQAPEYYAARWAETHRLREDLSAQLSHFTGWKIIPGVANFVLCHLPVTGPSAAEMVRRGRVHGLYVRDVGSMGRSLGEQALRIAVKDAATNTQIVQLLQATLGPTPNGRRKNFYTAAETIPD